MSNTDKSLTTEQLYVRNALEVLKEITGLDWVHRAKYSNPFYLHQTAIADRAYKFYWGSLGATFRLVEANASDISGVHGISGLTIESAWKGFKDDTLTRLARWNDSSLARQAAIKIMTDAFGEVDTWAWDRYTLKGMVSSEKIHTVSVDDLVSATRQKAKFIMVSDDFDKHYDDLVGKAAKWDEHCKNLSEYPTNKIDTLLDTLIPDEDKRKILKAKIDLMQHFGYADKNWLYKEILNGK